MTITSSNQGFLGAGILTDNSIIPLNWSVIENMKLSYGGFIDADKNAVIEQS